MKRALAGVSLAVFAAVASPAIVVVVGTACNEAGNVIPPVDAAVAVDVVVSKDAALPSDGSSTVGEAGFDAACVTATHDTVAPAAYLQLVIDASASMAGPKWAATQGAVAAYVDELLQRNDPTLGLGLLVFAGSLDPSQGQGPYPTSQDTLPRAMDQTVRDALHARILGATPVGPSPVFGALRGAYSLIETMPIVPPLVAGGKKAVLLLADGPPSDDPSFQGALDLVRDKRDAKLRTFSVGLGPFPEAEGYSADFMGDVAVAGGTSTNPQCDAHSSTLTDICHIQVTPGGRAADAIQADLVNAFRRVHTKVSACEFVIDGGAPADAARTNVLWVDPQKNEHLLPQGAIDGWTVDPTSPDRVLLHGRACGDVSSAEGSFVRVLDGCPTQVGK